eukprot:gene5687-7851_t
MFRLIYVAYLFIEQAITLSLKHVSQKQRKGRQTLKETFMIPLFVLLFITYVIYSSITVYPSPIVYQKHSLPPLSTEQPWGIFNIKSKGNVYYSLISKRLSYFPDNHAGINALIKDLVSTYPDITAQGFADIDEVVANYQSNLFDTWTTLAFSLNEEQIATGLLITSQTNSSIVDYSILINPTEAILYQDNYTDTVYNKVAAPADAYWSSGYLTLQNFISSYLARQYDSVSSDFEINTSIQRYPKSPIYEDLYAANIKSGRWILWRWMGGTILAILIFISMLSYLTEIVRERQYKMKDLLEISGLINISYWTSYALVILFNTQLTIWFTVFLLALTGIFNAERILPYVALLTSFTVGVAPFAMLFGFIVNRSEYYGLPAFIGVTALTVGGCYLSINYTMSIGLKMFFSFLVPSVGLSLGVFTIETYLYHNNSDMDFDFVDHNKNYPSLQAINLMMCLSGLVYFLLTIGMPFDFIFKSSLKPFENAIGSKIGEMEYPCDDEDKEAQLSNDEEANAYNKINQIQHLLEVNSLSHIYPDGTHAVKDVSFKVKEGEVLSFLGANGAGKSTCMGMLCGTLDASFGDALVNGYSITNDRTSARRNLGIAMQQDIIWDDVNVEDHLLLFGRLRGLHGKKLRDDVTAMLDTLGFPEKRKFLAGTLSGGQKRRLCVGLSMVGGNSVVYLDEPTAGLDPVSRRQLWELVQKNRQGRAILLTTHFMDEADVLGDRIAIVKEGRLRAIGTSKFLKKRFGIGYMLRMSLKEESNPNNVLEEVSRFIPSTTIASTAGTELSLRLPREGVSIFPDLFEHLESHSKSLGILSFGIETTTLEEVFMRIVDEDNEQLCKNHEEANRMLAASAEERDQQRKELQEKDNLRNPIFVEQMNAILSKGRNEGGNNENIFSAFQSEVLKMLLKRFRQFTRSKGQWSMGAILPILIVITCAVILNSIPKDIIGPITAPFETTFYSPYEIPVGASNESLAESYFGETFTNVNRSNFVGTSYDSLNEYITEISQSGIGATSTNAIYFESLNNFTVMYNASYPINFPGLVTKLVDTVTTNATNGKLKISQSVGQLPILELYNQLNDSLLFLFMIALLSGSIGAGMSIVVGGERVSLVKHQQLASGASKIAYWTANFIFDFGLFYSFIFILDIALVITSNNYSGAGFGTVLAAGIPYVLAQILRYYCVSFLVADIKIIQSLFFYGSLFMQYFVALVWSVVVSQDNYNVSTNSSLTLIAILSILEPSFGYSILVLFQNDFGAALTLHPGKSAISVGYIVFLLLFIDCLIYGSILVFYLEDGARAALRSIYYSTKSSVYNVQVPVIPTDMDRFGSEQQVQSPSQLVINYDDSISNFEQEGGLGSTPSMRRNPSIRQPGMPDPDVAEERLKVRNIVESGNISSRQNAIFINNLRKVYPGRGSIPTKIAVKDVSISIPHGEVFGLLGANGAGKTTLLKMVSGQETPSSGFALINGYDVVKNTGNAQRSMGLCPQFDTLIERLTVRENLLYFGQIKGLVGEELTKSCEAFLSAMNIKKYENKLVMQLSGGNRRKVSLAVALLGAPPTVYLDEPSTGLDPVASRLMWRLLSKISSTRSTAIVLTTHNMLECEAVCTRICIMKLGEMVCLGDSQHLRSAHGTGFLLELNLNGPFNIEQAKHFVAGNFVNAVIVDEHSTMINFEIPRSSISKLSSAFKLLESHKTQLGIVDYALSQSTLEQVFLKQIRPNESDMDRANGDKEEIRTPTCHDYSSGYVLWLLAAFIPGLHHFYLGNIWRGLKYFFTLNEVYAGWFLDLFEMHTLVQKSVQEHGHSTGFLCCCYNCCNGCRKCCCCEKEVIHGDNNIDTRGVRVELDP